MHKLASMIVASAEMDNPSHQTLAHQLGMEHAFMQIVSEMKQRVGERKKFNKIIRMGSSDLNAELDWALEQIKLIADINQDTLIPKQAEGITTSNNQCWRLKKAEKVTDTHESQASRELEGGIN